MMPPPMEAEQVIGAAEEDGGVEEITFKAIRRDVVHTYTGEGTLPRGSHRGAGPTCHEVVDGIVERIEQACKEAGSNVRVEEKDIVR
jgi:hypothetical protein